jgi:hypothetical protein
MWVSQGWLCFNFHLEERYSPQEVIDALNEGAHIDLDWAAIFSQNRALLAEIADGHFSLYPLDIQRDVLKN